LTSSLQKGKYRTIYEIYVPYTKGSFSFVWGLRESGLCSSYPSGIGDQNMGINNSGDIKIWDEGYIYGMPSAKKGKLPKSFFWKMKQLTC